jgi:hypothetical protein
MLHDFNKNNNDILMTFLKWFKDKGIVITGTLDLHDLLKKR